MISRWMYSSGFVLRRGNYVKVIIYAYNSPDVAYNFYNGNSGWTGWTVK